MKKIYFIAIVMLVLLMAGESNAIIFGIRYSNINNPVVPGMTGSNKDGRFGIFGGVREKNSDFLFGFDYDRYKEQRPDSNFYARKITVNLGYRYQLFPGDKAAAMKLNPFVALHYFKSFSKFEADESLFTAAEAKYWKEMSQDSGGWLSLGAEYYLGPAFGFGAEGGILYSSAKSKALGYEAKINSFNTFAAILLTYYWQ